RSRQGLPNPPPKRSTPIRCAVEKRSSWSGLIIGSTTRLCAAACSISPGLWPSAPNVRQSGLTLIAQDCINAEMLPSFCGNRGRVADPTAGAFVTDPLRRRETGELLGAYYRSDDPTLDGRLFDLARALAVGAERAAIGVDTRRTGPGLRRIIITFLRKPGTGD